MVPCPQAHIVLFRWNGAEAAGTPFAIPGVVLLRLTWAKCDDASVSVFDDAINRNLVAGG